MPKYYAVDIDNPEDISGICTSKSGAKEWDHDWKDDLLGIGDDIILYEIRPIKKLVRTVTDKWVDIDEE